MRYRWLSLAAVLIVAGCSPAAIRGHGAPAPVPTTLSCPSGAIRAPGGPFCYALPTGFTNYSSDTNYGSGWTYRTLVSVGVKDSIVVLGGKTPANTDTLSPTALRSLYNSAGLLTVGQLNVVHAGPVATTRIAGGRAFVQKARFADGVTTTSTTIYRGRTIVSLQCQSQADATLIDRGCDSVIASLQVIPIR